jgi:hypothetical protein
LLGAARPFVLRRGNHRVGIARADLRGFNLQRDIDVVLFR